MAPKDEEQNTTQSADNSQSTTGILYWLVLFIQNY